MSCDGHLMASRSMSLRGSFRDVVSVAPALPACASSSCCASATWTPDLRSMSEQRCRSGLQWRAACAIGENFSAMPWRRGYALTTLRLRKAGRNRAGAQSRGWKQVRAVGGPDQSSFLSLEEAGLVEMTNLDMHERFLARLTVSSLNLLRVISKQEGVPMEELSAGRICDWFVKDKEKRSTNIDEATLKWDSQDW